MIVGLLKILIFVILLFSSSLSDRDRNDRFLLVEPPCVILIIGLSSNSLVLLDSVLLTLLGLRYLFLELPLSTGVLTVVEVVVVLPLSLYLEIEPEFAETFSIFDFDEAGVVYLLDPLLRNLLFGVEASVCGASV